jgi:putative ABC transport system permease protein
MRMLARLRSLCRMLFRTAQMERELDDELACAREELTARFLARGLAPEAAAAAAREELGRIDRLREDVRVRGVRHRLEACRRDLVEAWRGLARTPVFAATTVGILAGGIGAASAIFSVVNALLLQPLPYRNAHELVFVWQDLTQAGYPRAPLAGPELQDLRDRSTTFAAFGGIWANTTTLSDGTEPEQLRIGLVTPNFFQVLGAEAALGRTFEEGDDRADGDPRILLSAALWQRRYGADPGIVGRRIIAAGRPTTVVGVMAPGFRLLLPADAAIPDDQQAWMLLNRNALLGPRQQQFLRVVGRLEPGASLADGQQEIATISRQVGQQFSSYGPGAPTFYAVGLQADATRDVRPALLALFAAVTLLLTIGCVNVAGLLVARAAARARETALRLAIGASRGRLFRQFLLEGLLLSLIGGTAGLFLAQGLLDLVLAVRPAALSRLDLTTLDLRVFGFAAGVSILWGVLFSMAPFVQVFRTEVRGALSGARHTPAPSAARARAWLVVLQVAISCVLLVTAGLLARGFHELQQVQVGFRDDGVLTFKLSLAGSRHRGPQAAANFSHQFRTRLRALPGVSAVGAVSHLPYDTVPNWGTPYLPEGTSDPSRTALADARAVTPGYFETIGAQLLAGRWFTEADSAAAQPVAIVDAVLAARTWPGESAIGKRVLADPGTTGYARTLVTIVGVVRHLRHREVTRDLREQMYFPAPQSYRNPMAYAVRVDGAPAAVASAVRQVLSELDPALPIHDVRPLSTYMGDALAVRSFTLVLALAFAASAVVLAAVGIYGVTAFSAARRRREFGVRFALGARTGQIAALVVGDATRIAAAGTLIGACGAAAASRLLRTQIYSVSPLDPLSYIVGIGVVLASALVASALPAYRAAHTSPLESLRLE